MIKLIVLLQCLLIAVVLLFPLPTVQRFTYYVSTDGDNSNTGDTPENSWRTIQHATEVIKPGDRVYIKAGHYTHDYLTPTLSGTEHYPIEYIGYSESLGDLQSGYFQAHLYSTPKIPDYNKFPTLDGEYRGEHYSGIVINKQQYIHVKNIHVTGYQANISLYAANHNHLENIVTSSAMDTLSYGGIGLNLIKSNYNNLKNIKAISNQGENISFKLSNYNLLENCESHGGLPADDNGRHDGTDYYIVITQSHDNTIRNCLAHRHSAVKHGGHGIGIKANGIDSYSNRIIDSVVRGLSKGFYVRHHQTFDNEFINCAAYGDETIPGLISNGFIVRDGAHNNTFKSCKGEHLDHSITFFDTVEDGGFGQEQNNNLFSECEFNQILQSIIWFDSSAHNNVFNNIIVNEAPRLIKLTTANQPVKWTNNILKDSQLNNVGTIGVDPLMNTQELALQLQNISINTYSQSGITPR